MAFMQQENRDKPRRKRRAGRFFIFALAFSLACLAFGFVLLWALTEYIGQTMPAASSSRPHTTRGFAASDIRTLLIVTDDGGAAGGFVLVTADPAGEEVRVTAFPRETVVDVGTEQLRLFELYARPDKGVSACAAQLSQLTGQAIDFHALVTYKNAERIVNRFENHLIFDIPETVRYNDDGGFSTTLQAGTAVVTGAQAVAMMRHTDWQGGRRMRAEIQGQIVAALINQYLVAHRADKGPADFTALINLVNSNIMASDYLESQAGLERLAQRNTGLGICRQIPAPGSYVGNGDAIRFEYGP